MSELQRSTGKGFLRLSHGDSRRLKKNLANATFGRWRTRLIAFVALCIPLHGGSALANCENPDVLRFSLVPEQGAERQLEAYRPLIEALEAKLDLRIEVVRPSSYASVVDGLINGRLDLAILGPASYVAARLRDPGIVPFVSHAKQGGVFHEPGSHYRSLLIVRAASRFDSIDRLRGGRLALTDPGSTSGALLPRQQFERDLSPRLGAGFEQFFGTVGYAGDHRRAALAVLDQRVDAAYVADDVLSALALEGRLKPSELRVLWQSGPIHRDPYVYRQRLCEPLKRKLRDAFLSFAAGDTVLARLGIERFLPVSDRDYRPIYELFPAQAAK